MNLYLIVLKEMNVIKIKIIDTILFVTALFLADCRTIYHQCFYLIIISSSSSSPQEEEDDDDDEKEKE